MFKVGKCLLADRLKQNNLTQVQLAELSRVPKSTLSEYVNNKHLMSLEAAANIASVLNCRIEDLYTWISVTDDKNR